jgi:hypothetical protein
MHSVVSAVLVAIVVGALHADRVRAAANIPPEVPKFYLGSCGTGDEAGACTWDCSAGQTCCGDGACEGGGCGFDAVEAVSARLVVRANDCPSGGGAVIEFGLRGTGRNGSDVVVPSRTVDLCTANVQCGAFADCPACVGPDCPPLCADPETTCPPPLPQASSLCENPGGGPLRPGGRPEVCRDPPGSDQLPTPGRRFCEADMAEPLRFERWLRFQPLLPAIAEDLSALFPAAAGPAVILSLERRPDDPSPDRKCGEILDPTMATPCCDVHDLPDGGREASCCVTVALLRHPKLLPVPLDLASAPVGLGSLSVTTNPCAPLCGNGKLDPGEACEPTKDAACPGQCLPAGHPSACRCNRPPRCENAVVEPAVLWPPTGKLVPVTLAGVDDPDGDAVAVGVTAITQNEPLASPHHPGRCVDGRIADDGSALVRAERRGSGDGRAYQLTFVADDGRGGQCTGAVTTCVPRDRAAQSACVDQGSRFDSTACPD